MSDSDVRYAGFWIRVVAALLDIILMGGPIGIILVILFGYDSNMDASFFSFKSLLIDLVYLVIFTYLWVNWNGQTPGKKLLRIKIVSFNKKGPMTYSKSFVRYIGLLISITVVLGWVMIGLNSDKRGLHDFMAGTCVIHEK